MRARLRSLGSLVLWSLGLWSLGPFLRAHAPGESTARLVVRPDRLELTLTMAQATALQLIDPDARIRALEPANIAEHAPRLEREARLLFILTSLGRQLAPTAVAVALTDETDLAFTVAYPRPAPGRLLIHAAFLRRLGDEHGSLVTVDDETGRNLGWEPLRRPRASFAVAVPAVRTKP